VFEVKHVLAGCVAVEAEAVSRPFVEAVSASVKAEDPAGNTTLPMPPPTDGDSTVKWGTLDCCADGVGDGTASGRGLEGDRERLLPLMFGGGCRGGTPVAPPTVETLSLLVLRTTVGLAVVEEIVVVVAVTVDIRTDAVDAILGTGLAAVTTTTGGDVGRSFDAATTLSCTNVSISKE
jgi:hypothetical protein